MTGSSVRSAPQATPEPDIGIRSLARPFFLRWRLVGTIVLVAVALGAAVIFLPARRYRASVVLAAVPNTKGLSIGGGISAILGSGELSGLQATPFFVTRLLLLRSVIMSVAMSEVPGTSDRIIERVARAPLEDIRPADIERKMRNILTADVDKQTGLITFSAEHVDSALTRQIVTQIVSAASKTYIDVVRAQARSQRIAQEARVDSAKRQLHEAEQEMLNFVSTNRSYAPYSAAFVERQRIERQLNNAEAVYSQAINDRETAIASELEATPAVVVVDEIPKRLLPVPRKGLLKLLLSVAIGLSVATAVLFMKGDFDIDNERR